MDSFDQLDATEDYSAFFSDDVLDIFGGSDWAFDVQLPEVSFPELECAGFLDSPEDVQYFNECSDSNGSFESRLDLFSGGVSFELENSALPVAESFLRPTSEQTLDDTRTDRGRTIQSRIEDQEDENDSQKGKWRDSIVVFPANANANPIPKRRKAFGPTRREEVALNRLIGACTQCKVRKGRCNFGIPCSHCIKRAGSVALAQQICIRRGLIAARFESIDLFEIASHECRLNTFGLPFLGKPQRHVFLWYPRNENKATEAIPEANIKFSVVDFEHPDLPQHQITTIFDYYFYRTIDVPDGHYAIHWQSMPSVDELIRGYSASRVQSFYWFGPFKRLQRAVKQFADYYCRMDVSLPLKELLAKALLMHTLFNIWGAHPVMKNSLDGEPVGFGSSTVFMQLRLVVARALVPLELEVLSKIDKLVHGSENIGRQNPLALWACLCTLILCYKEHMILTKSWVQDRGGQRLHSLTGHMYNALTAIYAALYKTTSPLTFDWRKEEVSGMLCGDDELIKLFCNIKTEMFWFQSAENRLLPEDTLFKTLVVENENKLIAAHKKAAKKQGLL